MNEHLILPNFGKIDIQINGLECSTLEKYKNLLLSQDIKLNYLESGVFDYDKNYGVSVRYSNRINDADNNYPLFSFTGNIKSLSVKMFYPNSSKMNNTRLYNRTKNAHVFILEDPHLSSATNRQDYWIVNGVKKLTWNANSTGSIKLECNLNENELIDEICDYEFHSSYQWANFATAPCYLTELNIKFR